MMENYSLGRKLLWVLRSVLTAYITTAVLLLILAFFLFKLELDEGKVAIGIIIVYVLSCFIGGFTAGRSSKNRKFLWGLITGSIYFVILLLASLGSGNAGGEAVSLITTGAICLSSGMLGGMTA